MRGCSDARRIENNLGDSTSCLRLGEDDMIKSDALDSYGLVIYAEDSYECIQRLGSFHRNLAKSHKAWEYFLTR